MEIVQHGVLDIRRGNLTGQRLFPDPFGNPHAPNFRTESTLQPMRITLNLADAISRWDHRQDRFVEGTTDDLDTAGDGQLPETIQILGVMIVEPFHQWPAGVQGNAKFVVFLENVQERQITILIRLFNDAVKIAHRLMVVKHQAKSYERVHFILPSWIALSIGPERTTQLQLSAQGDRHS